MSVFRYLCPFFLKQWKIFVSMSILCVFWSLKEALFPYFSKKIVDNLVASPAGSLNGFYFPAFCLILLWTVMECAVRFAAVLQKKSFPLLRAQIRQEAFETLMGQHISFYNDQLMGDIGARMTTLPPSCEKVFEVFLLHIVSIGCAYLIGLFLFLSVHWVFFLSALGWFIGYFCILFYWVNRVNQSHENHARSSSELNGKMVDTLSNVLNVRLFSRLNFETEGFLTFQNKEIIASQQAFTQSEKMKIMHSILSVIFLTVMMGLLGIGWKYQYVSAGDFILIPMLTFSMLGMIWWLGGEVSNLFREVGSIQATLKLLARLPIKYDENPPIVISKGEIRFQNISFGYENNQKQFEDFSLTIHPKEVVGIVGPSGAGKSTLFKLILGLHSLQKGVITIDGFDIHQVSQTSLWDQISVIPQDPVLFHRSILDNILYGKLDENIETVFSAAKLAHCHSFIEALPDKYATLVGEKGYKLSSGQRQRVALARAFLKNAPILLVDEATSSMDVITEKEIHESLCKLRENKTIVIIAHRLATLQFVDRIIVIDQGKIIEEGSYRALKKGGGLLSKMIDTHQFIVNDF